MTLPPDDFDPLTDLLDVLDLQHVSHSKASSLTGGVPSDVDDVFLGRNQPQPHGRVFGGQVVAQAVIAAGRTVAALDGPPRLIHSLHGYFLRPGDPDTQTSFVVERLRDGSSFSARRVHAIQNGKAILSMIFSFQVPAGGIDHHADMPAVPDPETLPSGAEDLVSLGDRPETAYTARTRPIDIRHCQGSLYAKPRRQPSPNQSVWLRALGTIPEDDPLLHAAVLAYASDYTLLEAALRRHRLAWADPRLRAASLDHAMWFHRPARADEWILYTQASPSAQSGRALGLGQMFSEDGMLVASVAQEGMLRLKE
nr:acyl-CoA thioesterase II [Gephyromycinifex aptenodytis]